MRKDILLLAVCAGAGMAQRGGGDWSTAGFDAQRSSWVRSDPKISKESLERPGFSFLWKLKLGNGSRQAGSPAGPMLIGQYIGYRGFRSFAFYGGTGDAVYGVEADLGRIEWSRPITIQPAASSRCGGVVLVTRAASTAIAPAPGPSGYGRSSAAKSDVGDPDEGAPIIKQLAAASAAAGRGGRGGFGFAGRGQFDRRAANMVYALSPDGMLHGMFVSNGEEPEAPVKFLPPNASAQGLIVVNGVAYVSTSQGCGGAENGVYALDLATKHVVSWDSKAARVSAPSVGPDGTVYVGTGNGELVALEPKALAVKDTYRSGKEEFTSAPVIFEYKDRVLMAAATKDGRLYLLDTKSMRTPLFEISAGSEGFSPSAGALASWQDRAGSRWLLAPRTGAVAGYKLAEQGGGVKLESGWVSRDMTAPLTPIIINGVVFAASGGSPSSATVLYALDGQSGKELWSSGKTIASYVRGGGIAGGNSQVYVATQDGTVYAFGFPIEH